MASLRSDLNGEKKSSASEAEEQGVQMPCGGSVPAAGRAERWCVWTAAGEEEIGRRERVGRVQSWRASQQSHRLS